jgi:hypothetical protein
MRGNFLCLGFQNLFFGYFFGGYFLGGYLFGRWRRLDFLEFGEIGNRIKAEEFEKGPGGSIDDGPSGQLLSAHYLNQSLFQKGVKNRSRIDSSNLFDRRSYDGLAIGNDG